ncbi:MAG: DUF4258 domain-containing protein [Candidatus Kapabacteria bacterium]|nr:DUF4258 domain-containing protein [Candidatus Kapabacteria bacterium]
MKIFEWDESKNNILKKERNISFEEIVLAINNGGLIETIDHPNKFKYPQQMLFLVRIKNYIYTVPFVLNGDTIFLKTIYPDRKATKKYLGDNNE